MKSFRNRNLPTRSILVALASVLLPLLVALPVSAYELMHNYANPGWDGYTTEYFDYLMGWDSGNYWGQTSVWTANSMSYLISRNKLYEVCNGSEQTDADTGNHWTYNTTQSWVEADGGYNTDFWDCLTFQSIESWAWGTYHNNSPTIDNTVGPYINYKELK